MGDDFKPRIACYGSLAVKGKKVLVPLSLKEKKKTRGLRVVQSSSVTVPKEKAKQSTNREPNLITLVDDTPGPSISRKKSVEELDDGVITLSPDFVPFTLPDIVELSKETENNVLAVVTLDDVPSPQVQSKKDKDIEIEIIEQPKTLTDVDPLQVVITVDEEDSNSSSPVIIMDTTADAFSHPIDGLMNQIHKLIEKLEPNSTLSAKVIAKVNRCLTAAPETFVRSEEFEKLVRNYVKEVENDDNKLYPELKKILDVLKLKAKSTVEPVAGPSGISSTADTKEDTTTTAVKDEATDSNESPVRKVIKPITLNSKDYRHYDKKNYVKAMELFEELVSTVEAMETNPDTREKLVLKLRNKLENAEKKYLHSRVFIETLVCSINGMIKDPPQRYSFLKKTSDELKANMKCNDGAAPSHDNNADGQDPADDLDEGLDDKTRLKIRRLEEALKKIVRVIRELETEELNWSDDDDENSAYIKVDKYQQRYMKIYKKICELRKRKVNLGRSTHCKIRFSETQYPAINNTIEKYYNATREFPDFGEIYSLVKEVSRTDDLRLTPAQVQRVAETAFESLGEILKRRRQADDCDLFLSRLGTENDPAEEDKELARKLEDNQKHWKKIDEIMNEYVRKQEERKKGNEEESVEENNDDEEEEEDEDEEKSEEKQDNNSDSDESDDYKENDRGSSDVDTDRSDSERSNSKTRTKEETKSNTTEEGKKAVDQMLEDFDITPCNVALEDCVELFHNSPDKEASFFKYLKLAKLDDDLEIENVDVEMKETENLDVEMKESENVPSTEDENKDSQDDGMDSTEESKVIRKLDLGSEVLQKDRKSLEEDQNSIVTSTTDPEIEDKLGDETLVDSAGKSNDSVVNRSSESIPCVTSSMDHNEPVSLVEDGSITGKKDTNIKKQNLETDVSKTIEALLNDCVETCSEMPDQPLDAVEGDSKSTASEDMTNVRVNIGDDDVTNPQETKDGHGENTKNSHGVKGVADFIDKDTLKLQLDDDEDVNEIFDYLKHCQVELTPQDMSAYLNPSNSDNEQSDQVSEREQSDHESDREDSDQVSDREDSDHVSERESKTETEVEASSRRKAEKRQLSEASSDDAESCGIPVTVLKRARGAKATKPSKRKREPSPSSEEEEEESEESSDDTSDEDFNPNEEARAIRKEREEKKGKSRRTKRRTPVRAGFKRNTPSDRTMYSAGAQAYSPRASTSYAPYIPPSSYQAKTSMPYIPRGISLGVIRPPLSSNNPLPKLKNVTISQAERPSQWRPNIGPARLQYVGPSAGYAQRPTMGPSSRMRPNMGPSGPQRPQMGPANARFRSNIGPASSKLGPNVVYAQRPPMGPTGRTIPNMAPRPRPMGPASARSQPAPISQSHMNKTRIRGGVQVQWNKMQASQAGGVNTLQKESTVKSKQRIDGNVLSQDMYMKHSISKDADSGAGQDTRVTSNVEKTVTKDGRQVIRKVKKTVTTNVEIEEIVIDPGEVIDID